MGRCQGGFCMPSLIEILAKELNIPYDEESAKDRNQKIINYINEYNDIEGKEGFEEEREEEIKGRIREGVQIAQAIIPIEELKELLERKEIGGKEDKSNKKEEQIRLLAMLEAKLEEYAYSNVENIEELTMRVSQIGSGEKTKENKEELLKQIEEIRIRYKVFEKYLYKGAKEYGIEERLKKLYKVKFDLLTLDINEQENQRKT